jgi:hypothetical protein
VWCAIIAASIIGLIFLKTIIIEEEKGDILSMYDDGEYFKQLFILKVHEHVYNVWHSSHDSRRLFSTDDGVILGMQANGN